jgi:hypothetical protein
VYDSKVVFGDSICRANIGADWIFAVHTHLYRGLYGDSTLHIVNMNHALLPVGFTLSTGHLTGMAANAALHVDEKLHLLVVLRVLHG